MLLDIKSGDPDTYRKVTGKDLAPTLRFAERLNAMGKPVWVRFVLAPGLTDDPDNIEAVARFVAPMKNVEWVEVLPFHQMGAFKWKSLGLDYPLDDTAPPSETQVRAALDIFRRRLPRALTTRVRTSTMAVLSDLLGAQPILALFLAMASATPSGRSTSSASRSASAPCCSSAWRSARSRPRRRSPDRSG